MINKVIYLGYSTFSEKTKSDFYFKELETKGIDVHYWDLSNIFFKGKITHISCFSDFKTIDDYTKFREELNAIKHVFGDDVCVDLDCFNSTNKIIALQIVSGREGISLRNAEALVYYNIDFSATSYWQSRDRMTTKDRKYNKVYWVFSEKGIEDKIYKAVLKKKDYTLSHFKRDLLDL